MEGAQKMLTLVEEAEEAVRGRKCKDLWYKTTENVDGIRSKPITQRDANTQPQRAEQANRKMTENVFGKR